MFRSLARTPLGRDRSCDPCHFPIYRKPPDRRSAVPNASWPLNRHSACRRSCLPLAYPLSPETIGVPGYNAHALTLDVSHLPKGAYFVVVPTEEGRLHGRFVKE